MTSNRHLFGVVVVLAGGAFLSTSGILIRVMENPDGWQILFYRSGAFFLSILAFVAWQHRGRTLAAYRATGWSGIAAAAMLSLGTCCYIFAILYTTVANVVFIMATTPLMTALLAWIFFRQKVTGWSLVAMLTALAGISLMFLDGLEGSGMFGNLLALSIALSYGFYLLLLHHNRRVDMVPATGLSGLITLVVAALLVESFVISDFDLVICLALGSLQFGLGFLLLTIGSRYIPPAEVALYALTEMTLNPIWVWIGVGEVPGRYALYGSGIVLASVLSYSLIALRRERRTAAHASLP